MICCFGRFPLPSALRSPVIGGHSRCIGTRSSRSFYGAARSSGPTAFINTSICFLGRVLDAERRHYVGRLSVPAPRARLQHDELADAVRSDDDSYLAHRLRRKVLATLSGGAARFIAFALSIVRTAWLGWLIAVVFLITILRGGRRVTLVLGIAAVALIAIPIITTGDIGERFTKRLDSLQDLEGDKSFQERSALYGSLTQQALTTFWE